MIINSVDCHWHSAARYALALRRALPDVIQSAPTLNVYLTPAAETSSDVQPFPLHNDEQEVYVLQIGGAKQWRVQHGPSERYKGQVGGGVDQPDVPAMWTELGVGDMMYIPRHHNHEGWTEGTKPSVSVSVTVGHNESESDLAAAERHQKCQTKAEKKAPSGITTGHRLTLHGPYGAKGELGSEEKKGTRSWLRKVSDDIRARLDAKSPDGARRPDTGVRKLSEAAVAAMGGDGAPTIAALHRALG